MHNPLSLYFCRINPSLNNKYNPELSYTYVDIEDIESFVSLSDNQLKSKVLELLGSNPDLGIIFSRLLFYYEDFDLDDILHRGYDLLKSSYDHEVMGISFDKEHAKELALHGFFSNKFTF